MALEVGPYASKGPESPPVTRIRRSSIARAWSGIFASSAVENLGKSCSVLAQKGTPRYPGYAIAEHVLGDTAMNVKSLIVVTAVVAAVAFAACRREVRHEPMKLGAEVPAASQVAR